MNFWLILSQIFPYAVVLTIPLLITALGGLFSERSGVVNIGLEGLMVIGFFTSAIVIKGLENSMPGLAIPLGLLAAMIGGAIFSLLHAFASINLNANQVISGTAINMMAGALTVYLARTITGSGNIQIRSGILRLDIPGLSKIPILGPLFFTQTYWTTWLVLLIVAISWFMLYKTAFGLRLRACGEHPSSAASAGVNVYRMRYIGVLISGAFAGLGGGATLAGRPDFRAVEASGCVGSNLFLRFCPDDSQCFPGSSRTGSYPSAHIENFPLRRYAAGSCAVLEIIAGAEGCRAALFPRAGIGPTERAGKLACRMSKTS